MVKLRKLVSWWNELLDLKRFEGDPSNNGLQVEGDSEIAKIAFGVDASLALFEAAADSDSDIVFVHHGLSWGNGFKRIVGLDTPRIRTLFVNGISLYAAHLPLDAHPEIGHNAVIAEKLELRDRRAFAEYGGANIGMAGDLDTPIAADALAELVNTKLGFKPAIYGTRDKTISTVGVISGGAGIDGLAATAEMGLDCLVTGEFGHTSWHPAEEHGLTVLAGGHYFTEMPGIKALMEKTAAEFDVDTIFIDIPTGL